MGAITRLIPGVGQVEAGLDAIGFAARHRMLIGGLAVSGVLGLGGGAAIAYGQHLNFMSLEATADLNKAHTSSKAALLAYDDTTKLDVATAYFSETFVATKISYIINNPGIDVIPDAEINEQLDGFAANKYEIPLSALQWSINPQTGKHDVVVDGSKATVLAYWPGSGPDVKQFTVNKDGKGKNFGDRSGFRNSLLHGVASNLRIINLDTASNTMDDLDARIAHDIKLKALEALTETCTPKLETRNEAAINKAIVGLLPEAEKKKLGEVTIKNLVWKLDVPPVTPKKGVYPNSYEIKNFNVDESDCDVPVSKIPASVGVHE